MGSKRTTVGIFYQPSNRWIAGAYYLQNIVSSLKVYCPYESLPKIIVFCNSEVDFNDFKRSTNYPRLICQLLYPEPDKVKRFLFKIIKKTTGLQITPPMIKKRTLRKVRFVYPINDLNLIPNKKKIIAWIPDFQEKYYPNFFSLEENESRKKWHKRLISNKIPIVFSSHDVQSDFHRFYPEADGLKTFVLPFTVSHPDFSMENIDNLKSKYEITGDYLFCANQFWIHKNHLTLFKAINIIRSRGSKLLLVCSGALHDYRANTYCSDLIRFIEQNNLTDSIKILGFIKREEQLCLMNNSYAIVQPSLFEGWSTVVEDVKRLNKFIFLSNLSVHHEQNPTNVCFFDPCNEQELAEKILSTKITTNTTNYIDFEKQSGKAFLEIINNF